MKKFVAFLLLLSACDSDAPEGQGSSSAPAPSAAAGGAAPTGEEAARIQQRVQQFLAPILIDAGSARYANLRSGAAGAVCGDVDSKQGDGKYSGPRPFVVTPDGVAVISTASRILFNDALDPFSDFYIRWCASPEELQRLGPDIAAGAPPPDDLGSLPPPMEDIAAAPPAELPPPDASAPAATAPAEKGSANSRWGAAGKAGTPAPQPKSTDEESFSSAVIRRREETK